ncbi:MAG: substrate-binding domain-containing protein [Nitrospinota bacterium]
MRRKRTFIIAGLAMLWLAVGPGDGPSAGQRLRLATTTSTANSGLLDVLLPPFEKAYGVTVDVIPVGTGKALKLGERGDVDVLMVHAPPAEEEFVRKGFGVGRRQFMYNDFVIVGPSEDPAGIRGGKDAVRALLRIRERRAAFVSRGDDSGTHKKERALWASAGETPSGRWYREVGQGMGDTLVVADELKAYTLSDRATYLALRGKIRLEVLVEGDKRLFNPYGIIAVNPARHPHVKIGPARDLIRFVTGPVGQRIIGGFQRVGRRLFVPTVIPQGAQ